VVLERSRERELAGSADMVPVEGTVDVDVPVSTLWEAFTRTDLWPRWNRCMLWVRNRDLVRDRRLLWAFRPLRRWYPYVLPAVARIVEVKDKKRVTWEITALPGFYARPPGPSCGKCGGRTRFGSWEKAMGRGFRLMRWFWVPHFVFVKDRSLEGARLLEEAYLREGSIEESTLPGGRRGKTPLLLLLPVLAGATALVWFYLSYVRQRVEELAPGVYAVFGGGGNSLVVQGGEEVLLVDPKFSPASRRLRGWISRGIGAPVGKVVNTHYHYDHTQGNVLYPGAQIIAHKNVPVLMLSCDNDFNSSAYWESNRRSLPDETLDGGQRTVTVGGREVVLSHPGRAHTSGDLMIWLPEYRIVATGDLLFNGHYPFLDRDEGGASIHGLIRALRDLAGTYPEAVFLPGHGPLARAGDLRRHADYLEFLQESVEQALRDGLSEDEAVERIDLSGWDLSILPSFHGGKLTWATAKNNVRWVYQMSKGQRGG
jgi:glyoxylase-like metal-dependent hydrolase (beta-lactamase superfamily II)